MELIRAAAEFIRVIVRTAPANAGRTHAWAQTGLATAGGISAFAGRAFVKTAIDLVQAGTTPIPAKPIPV
jgi:hypothetical protein